LRCHLNRADSQRFLSLHPAFDEKKVVAHIREAVSARKPVFYVVVGTSGSGRTVTSGRILQLYYGLREQQAKRDGNAAPKVTAYERKNDGNLDARQVARGILKELADEVAELGTDFEDTPVAALKDGIAKLRADFTIDDLASVARGFSRGVFKLNGSMTCVIENVPTTEIFRAVRKTFERTDAAVVCTIKAEQSGSVLGALDPGELSADLRVELDKLTPQKSFELARLRWRIWKGSGNLPFDSSGLLAAFIKRQRTVGKSLGSLGFMLDSKLSNYGGTGCWPSDSGLGFDQGQIEDNFENFDRGQRQQ
jgi:hypothetical protein